MSLNTSDKEKELATGPGMYLLEDNNLRKTDDEYYFYYLMTPGVKDRTSYRIGSVYNDGQYNYQGPNDNHSALRPVISHKGNNKIIAGTGSETDPWIIE